MESNAVRYTSGKVILWIFITSHQTHTHTLISLFLSISYLSLFHFPHVFLNIIIPSGSSFKDLVIVQVFSESFHVNVPFVC